MSSWDKYARGAEGWSEHAYADPRVYLAHRARLVVELGPRLEPDDVVLDLACGDGGLSEFLPGLAYVGVDASPEMVESGRRAGRAIERADLNDYVPPQPVQATTIFRAVYYARDRASFFARVAGYTERKLVFDLNPRQFRLEDVRADLRSAGFDRMEIRPFFVSQTRVQPRVLTLLLRLLERSGPLARVLLRSRFSYMCSAYRSDVS